MYVAVQGVELIKYHMLVEAESVNVNLWRSCNE